MTAAANVRNQSLMFAEMEICVFSALAYHQPIDRAGFKDIFSKDIRRDLLA